MKYVLDTNAVSALMRGDEAVIDRLAKARRPEVKIPQPVFAEIAYGIARLPQSRRKTKLRQRLGWICAELSRVEWSDEVSECFGEVKAKLEKRGCRIEDFDVAIAAHALAEGAVLVTANTEHMERVPGVTVEDWSTA